MVLGNKSNLRQVDVGEEDEDDSLSSFTDELQPLLLLPPARHRQSIVADYFSNSKSVCINSNEMLKLTGSPNGAKTRKNEIDSLQAWLTLALVFLINANTLSMLKVYGLIYERIVSQKYYTREEASWPVSTASTIQSLAGLLTPILATKMSWRKIELIQTAFFVSANVGAYYSTNLAMDILCIGVIQGVAFSIRYNMNVIVNNEYFHKYRATAMGLSLAGSSCGVFYLKPLMKHVLDISGDNFRNAYLAMAILMSFNIIFGFFIRKPIDEQESTIRNNISNVGNTRTSDAHVSIKYVLFILVKNPSIHCIWIMQTIYFYISRTYTIFIVDYGVDKGFKLEASRNLLNFWVCGEVGGRLLLGSFVDMKFLDLKWNIVLVNLLLALSGYALLFNPSSLATMATGEIAMNSTITTSSIANQQLNSIQQQPVSETYFWFFGLSIALVAALSSLLNIMILPFGQEYLGKKNVPWAFALGSVVTSVFLLLRPLLIGLSRDYLESYNPLIIVMSSGPFIYALIFLIFEPYLKRHRYSRV